MNYSSDDVDLLRDSMDNLRMLKILHDAGYNVSNMGTWARYSQYDYGTGGMDLFCECIQKIFGNCEMEEVVSSHYTIYRLTVSITDISLLLRYFEKSWTENHFKPYMIQICDYTSVECKVRLTEDSLVIEFHDTAWHFSQFLGGIIQIARVIDELMLLALPLHWKEMKRDARISG